jgi:hypothetical protein
VAGGATQLITLTSPGAEDSDVSLDLLSARWKAFHLRLRRRIGPFEYFAIVELQRRGSPHFHILVRGGLVSASWVAKAAAGVGFGKVSDVGPVRRGIAGYLTKQIGPGTSGDLLPTHFRRARWSRGWVAPRIRPDTPARREWYVVLAGTRDAAASAVARGYRLIALVHGPRVRHRRDVRWITPRGLRAMALRVRGLLPPSRRVA